VTKIGVWDLSKDTGTCKPVGMARSPVELLRAQQTWDGNPILAIFPGPGYGGGQTVVPAAS